MKRILSLILLTAGMILMLYPWISNALYEHVVDSEINVYENQILSNEENENDRLLTEAAKYNEALLDSHIRLTDPLTDDSGSENSMDYNRLLNSDDSGLMCFIEIPEIDVYLPVYHGTSAEVLEKGIGHIEHTSLPIGGAGSHAVLSGHTGIESSKMFTDLILLREGDLFYIHVLGKILAYRVTDIHVIEPEDTSKLVIVKGKDLVSLLTCTPYGINSHRLVVTGERVEYSEEAKQEAAIHTGKESSQWMKGYKKDLLTGCAITFAGIFFTGIIKIIRRIRHA